MEYTVYDTVTGRILRTGEAPDSMVDAQAIEAGEVVIRAAADELSDYVIRGQIAPRPSLSFDKTAITAGGTDTATLVVGEAFTAIVNGEEITVSDGTLEIVSSEAGTFTIEVDHWPYRRLIEQVIAS